MLQSILKNIDGLRATDHVEMRQMVKEIDEELLISLKNYLEECYELRLYFSMQNEPTLGRVIEVRSALISMFK